MNHDKLAFNGIDGVTGDYLSPPMTAAELAQRVMDEEGPENLDELIVRHDSRSEEHLGLIPGVEARSLAQTGWGAIFARDAEPAVRRALEPLLAHRESAAGARFHVFADDQGYRPGERKIDFMLRHGAGFGPVDPDLFPYYLLLVGDPEAIPYDFQFELDVQHAVGRIAFERVEQYAAYARSVVAAESRSAQARRASFFGVSHPGDAATQMSRALLIEPLATFAAERAPAWQIDSVLGEEATRDRLGSLLGGRDAPDLLMVASHGMMLPAEHECHRAHQGALICQDWPGPRSGPRRRPPDVSEFFAGEHLADDADLTGMISFFFACYAGGTPMPGANQSPAASFVAALPRDMLAHPGGGALAVIGHVDRAWSFSFHYPNAGKQTTVFEAALQKILDGYPLGAAMDYFNDRYAQLAVALEEERRRRDLGYEPMEPTQFSWLWTAGRDARNYAIIGDPAVRLAASQPDPNPSSS